MESSDKVKAIYKVTDTQVLGFFKEHRYLSNFHLHSIEYEGIIYPSNENAYQAAKTLNFEERLKFASLDPSKAKSMGRSISLREDWLSELNTELFLGDLITQVRDKIMYDLNVIKFSNPYLRNLLLSTGDKYLEETNWWRDDYWGSFNGQGLNKLGRILMRIRDEIRLKQQEAA
jgi:ribA/ribD-fused uncharacterized protein